MLAAVITVALVRAATSGDPLNVGPFALFAIIVVAALVAAVRLWARGGPR